MGYFAWLKKKYSVVMDETLEEHDRKEHGGHYDPETMSCKLRDEIEQDIESMTESESPEERAKREYDEVVARYTNPDGTEKDGFWKAPNGKQSNLSIKNWIQVRTPSFKKWFGDWENDPNNASKVVDENGEPCIVYHGSQEPAMTEFSDDSYLFTSNSYDSAICYTYGDDELPIIPIPKPIKKEAVKKEAIEHSSQAGNARYISYLMYDGIKVTDPMSLCKENENEEVEEEGFLICAETLEELEQYDKTGESEIAYRPHVELVGGKWIDVIGNEYKTVDGSPIDNNKFSVHVSVTYKGKEVSIKELRGLMEKDYDYYLEDLYDSGIIDSYIRSSSKERNFVLSTYMRAYKDYLYHKDPNLYSQGGVYELFANVRHPYMIDCHGSNWDDIKVGEDIKKEGDNEKWTTDGIVRWAEDKGYDGVLFKDITDGSTIATPDPSDNWTIIYPKGVKSALFNNGVFGTDTKSIIK